MIPLPFLWKWLYTNFTPLEDGEDGGIAKEEVVKELLAAKEVDKEGNEQAGLFARALIGRYLCLLFKGSGQCKNRFTNPKQPLLFALQRIDDEERERRASAVPPFSEDLRLQILRELREEKLGRSSARNLLNLMTQPPKKKPRTMDNLNASQEKLSPPEVVSIASPPTDDGTSSTASGPMLSPPTSPNRRTLKRSASGDLAGVSDSKRRELPASASGGAAAHAAQYRTLRKQVSSPVLTQKGGAVPPLFTQQEPWKREVNDLWAKQLAMMREINTLKVELGRREAARQREILAMRQELDVMRAEIFRLRTALGGGPLPASSLSSSGGGKEEKEATGEEGAEAATSVEEDNTEPEKGAEETPAEMDTSLAEEDKASAGQEEAEGN